MTGSSITEHFENVRLNTLTLSADPVGDVQVFLNGHLMTAEGDYRPYTIAGRTITVPRSFPRDVWDVAYCRADGA